MAPGLGVTMKRTWEIGDSPIVSPPLGSYMFLIDTYDRSLTVFELFSWLQKRFRPSSILSVRWLTITALEAIASSR